MFYLKITTPVETVLSFLLLDPILFYQKTVDIASDTISDNRFGPHEYETDDTKKNRRRERCYEQSLHILPADRMFSYFRKSIGESHIDEYSGLDNEAEKDECRDDEPYLPCESFLDGTHIERGFSFQERSHDTSENGILRVQKYLEYEIQPNEGYDDERDRIFCFQKNEEQRKKAKYKSDTCRYPYLVFVDESISIGFLI